MCTPAAKGLVATLTGGPLLGYSVYSSEKAAKAQTRAQDQARADAARTAKAAEIATNKANQRQPDVAGMLGAAARAGQSGQGSTMLTGPSGIDPASLTLGKSSLLGGG